jgi:FtsH-binding integral membrane protein
MATTLTNRVTLGAVTTINQSFGWMFIGLLVTTLSSLVITSSQILTYEIINNAFIYFGLIIAELIVVVILSAKIQSMTFSEAIGTFLLYSFLNGLTLSSIFIVYTATSIVTTFLVTTVVFGIMAIYGYTTHRDLTSVGNLALMALIGVIVASLVNLFLKNNTFSYILSYLSLAIFIGLTAYDTQKIKEMESYSDNKNLGILGALTLYLDFINIFLSLLRILGKQRQD